jgi:nucleoside-diphosphate-sugar epimerase
MKVALTGSGSLLGQALVRGLGAEHEVRPAPAGDLRDEATARQAVAGAEALIHLAPLFPDLPAGTPAGEEIDLATRGTYVLLTAAVEAGVRRVVLGSTLAQLERYPVPWRVTESWQPLPDVTDPARVRELAVFLAEESAEQFARVLPFLGFCLRFGEVVAGGEGAAGAEGATPERRARQVHVEDAVAAVRAALTVTPTQRAPWPDAYGELRQGWWVYHIVGAGPHTRFPLGVAADAPERNGLGYAPQHTLAPAPVFPPPTAAEAAGDLSLLAPRRRVASRPVRRVVIFGAGGPLASAAARELAGSYQLRLTDLRPLAQVAAGEPQSPGAPLPEVLGPPHEVAEVDVADLDQVRRACEGMDAVINCTVVRPHPVQAFRVNTLGAYNVMRAAAEHGIRRVVHTGPFQIGSDRPAGYWWDFDVPDDAPGRPGAALYLHSKYLGQEIVRLFAEQYDLEVPALFFCIFTNPDVPHASQRPPHPMTVSWADAARALRRALEAPALPSPFEIVHILADLPHGKYSNAKARRLLGWQPRDTLASTWATP